MKDIEVYTYIGDKRVHIKMQKKVQLSAMTRYLTAPAEAEFWQFIREYRDINTIVDAGANMGFVSLVYAEAFPEATIYAIEPSPSTFEYLVYNCKDFPNIIPINKGCYPEGGYMELSFPDDERPKWNVNSGQKSIYGDGIESETVRMERLDDIVSERVDLFKLDVEGAEIDVMESAPRIINKDHPVLNIEFRGYNLERAGLTAEDLLSYILEKGYRHFGKWKEDPIFIHEKDHL